MVILKSKRFILRLYRKGDEKSLQKNINDRNVYRYTFRVPYPYKIKDAKYWIKRCIDLTKKRNKTSVNFAMDINGEVIGGIGLENIEKHKAEIGYWLAKRLWNQGIITEAVKLVTNFGFKKLKLKRIYATIHLKNKRSVRVLEKNGYKLEGFLKKNGLKDGKYFDTYIYAKTK